MNMRFFLVHILIKLYKPTCSFIATSFKRVPALPGVELHGNCPNVAPAGRATQQPKSTPAARLGPLVLGHNTPQAQHYSKIGCHTVQPPSEQIKKLIFLLSFFAPRQQNESK